MKPFGNGEFSEHKIINHLGFIQENLMPAIRLFSFFFILLLFVSLPRLAAAQEPYVYQHAKKTVVLDENLGEYSLGLYAEYLEDKENRWTVDDMTSQEISEKFVQSEKETLNFGYTDSAYWVRVTVKTGNQEPGTGNWLLEVRYPLLDHLELWVLLDGKWMLKETGDRMPFSYRDVRYHNFVFRIQTAPNWKQTLYLRVKTKGAMEIPLTLWSPVRFAEKVNIKQYASGIYYGLMWAMVFYNLFIFLSVRDTNYLFYVLYIISYILFQLSLSGEGYEYLWGNSPWWFNRTIPFFIVLTGFWVAQFSKSFLRAEKHSPRLDKALSVFMAGNVLLMGLSLTPEYALSLKLAVVWIIFEMAVVLITGAVCLKEEYRAARYFMVAWFTFLSGTIIYALKSFGVLPANFFTSYIMQIGSAMLVILLSLSLADRINTERKEKLCTQKELLKAQKEILITQEEAAEILEKEVADRTGELRASLEQVEYANRHILESIRYAEKIQSSMLPSKVRMNQCLNEYFIIEESKHIVGGDIYLFEVFDDGYLIAVIDCTGHGVPGALMTMLAGSAFKRIVKSSDYNNPARILKSMNVAVKTSLYPDEKVAVSDDGMDAGICFINTKTRTVTFAGARIPLIYVSDNMLCLIKGDRQSIGYKDADVDFDFTNHRIPILSDISFYLSTDGITDQTGGPRHFPFGNRRFQALLKAIWKKPFDEQKERIMKAHIKWKKKEEQRDDITVLGFGF